MFLNTMIGRWRPLHVALLTRAGRALLRLFRSSILEGLVPVSCGLVHSKQRGQLGSEMRPRG